MGPVGVLQRLQGSILLQSHMPEASMVNTQKDLQSLAVYERSEQPADAVMPWQARVLFM